MPEITWPISTAPGVNPTESGGRLINAYAEKAAEGSRSKFIWRRAPGLAPDFEIAGDEYRGAILVGTTLYVVIDDKVYSVLSDGTTAALSGTVDGTGPVTIARNMKAGTPDVLLVNSDGMSEIDVGGASVSDFTDADLPAVNSITWIDGYFIVTAASGKAYQSGLNDTTFASTDYTTAESNPDGLVRGVAIGRELVLMGETSTEFFGNAGNATGFAFNRGPVLNVGLASASAIAGFEPEFGADTVFVASDRTVRRLSGYNAIKVSPPDLDRLLEAVDDADDIEVVVFVSAGHPYCAVTWPDGTWVYDLTDGMGTWHERKSYGQSRWRARFCVKAFDRWIALDRDSGKAFKIDHTFKREDEDPLVWELRSTQAHRFPGRFEIDRASFDFVTGVGIAAGADPIESDPTVLVSWSNDGGRTFGTPLTRRLGGQGEDVTIDVNRCGIAPRRGRQWRLQISDPVEIAFLGGAMDAKELSA